MASVRKCVLLHGAGSTPEFVLRAFGPAVASAGAILAAPDVRGLTMPEMVEVLREAQADVVGGVSLGAHAAAEFGLTTDWSGPVYAVMPAWLGTPDAVSALTAHTAAEVERVGTARLLQRLVAMSPDDWITAELVRAWEPLAAADLAHILRVAAAQPGPSGARLHELRGRVTVVGLADDPTHPLTVARTWSRATSGPLHVVARHEGAASLARWLPGMFSASR